MGSFSLMVNDVDYLVDAEPEMPLLWVLRDVLGLTGTKYGCGIGACGACTVHIDGEAVQSCSLPLSAIGSRKVTTIEGLATPTGQRVQQAWLEENVSQCGYCQSGQIMTAVALLDKAGNPEEAQVDAAMKDVLCRCGTYLRIRNAIERAVELGGV